MFNTWKLSLNVLSNDSDINIIMTIVDRREGVAEIYIGKEIQMFVELVIIVILGVDTFFWHHHAQEDAFVLLQQFSLLAVLEGEVFDHVELDRYVGCFEHIQYAF